MDAVAILLVVALVSLLITRVATVALTVTGMPRPVARFQARSALSGVGYTTSESESVVGHPTRRRIVMALMLLGNLGLATGVAGLLGGFLRADAREGALRIVLLVAGLAAVYWISKSDRVDRHLSRLIGALLDRFTDLEVADVDRLLHLSGEFAVGEVAVKEGSWLASGTLGDLRVRDEGVVVLGVVRADGSYVGVPGSTTRATAGDTLVVYGRDDVVLGLASRDAAEGGDEHASAVLRHRRDGRDERARDRQQDPG